MIKKSFIKIIVENIKTLLGALFIAILIRSLIVQPFYIPSSSMEPTLLVGDRIFVIKYVYGYSKHSFPFSPNFSNKRFMSNKPKQGDCESQHKTISYPGFGMTRQIQVTMTKDCCRLQT